MTYATIVADPPWEPTERRGYIRGATTTRAERRIPSPYPTMTTAEVAALPIAGLATPDAWLFCWATNTYLPHALSIVAGWGFTYRQTVVWRKLNPSPFPGTVSPLDAEYLLVCKRGQPRRVGVWPSAVVDALRSDHSRKPDVFLDLVEHVSPGPYLELFARRQRLGWDTWGDEALGHVEMAS